MRGLIFLVRALDSVNDVIGRGVSWLTLVMVLTTFLVVIFRYVFNVGWVAMQESYVWLHGVVFMVGAGYTFLHDGHVRVDLIYANATSRFKAWVDLLGSLFLLIPVLVLVTIKSWPFVTVSWSRLEASREAGGLEGLFLLKSVILVFCLLTGLQGLSLIARNFMVLVGNSNLGLKEDPHESRFNSTPES